MKFRHRPLASTLAVSLTGALAAVGLVAVTSAAQPLSANPDFVPTPEERDAIKADYRADLAACKDGQTEQTRATCMAEAAAAQKEALSGELGLMHPWGAEGVAPDDGDRLANALERCDILPPELRASCDYRVIEELTSEPDADAEDKDVLINAR